jgi:DNA repair protein RadA/Sms
LHRLPPLGEVGLAGEVRAVPQPEIRLADAARLGFERVILPAANARNAEAPDTFELVAVETVEDALERMG